MIWNIEAGQDAGERRVLFSPVFILSNLAFVQDLSFDAAFVNLTKGCGQGSMQYAVMERVGPPFFCWAERGRGKGNVPTLEFLPTGYAAHLCYHPRCLKKERCDVQLS
jgi:hypothetical protein